MIENICQVCAGQIAFKCKKNGYSIFRCNNCAFLLVSPYPTDDEITNFYSSSYRGAKKDFYPKLNSRRRRAFLKALKFTRFIYGKKTIDIGCGGGIMAETFRRMGADSSGLDISKNSINFAKTNYPKCKFYCETFEENMKRDLRFDFIFTTELMEHLAGPHNFMRLIKASSKPKTHVYIATPDSSHNVVPSDISLWSDICPPEHLQWFNESNLKKLFSDYGFVLVKSYKKTSPALSLLFMKSE